MGKITCATCRCEFNKKCNAKQGRPSVSLNKRRRCDKYILEATKVKERQILKTIKMSYKEREVLRTEYKQELKQRRAAAKQGNMPQNSEHPLTGDLSRFTSTAGSDRRGG